jgi:hypothetical protein
MYIKVDKFDMIVKFAINNYHVQDGMVVTRNCHRTGEILYRLIICLDLFLKKDWKSGFKSFFRRLLIRTVIDWASMA